MPPSAHSRSVVAALAALASLVPACSAPADDPARRSGSDRAATRQFTADDRRAAQALSIGNEAALASADTPYDRALLCDFAIGSLTEQLQGRAALNAEQQRALAQAGRLFEREVERLAADRSAAQIEQDRQRIAGENPEQGRAVQIAIGCLRQLQ